MLFIAKLNGDPVAITAGGLVPITKPLIVTVKTQICYYSAFFVPEYFFRFFTMQICNFRI